MNLLKNKMGMRVLTLALCAALGGSVLAVKAESVAGETVVQEAVQDENMSESLSQEKSKGADAMKKHITSEHADLKWERLRLQYLRKCRRTLYTELLATDKLNEHLGEINEQADSMFSQLVKQLAEQQGITEELKAENQLLWVQQMNNVQNAAVEIVLNELIYC